MALLITFPVRSERLRAIDLLAEAGETYQGMPPGCYVVSDSAAKLLERHGVHVQVVGDKDKESVHAAGS
jgi:hypothetical protein